MMVMKGVSSVLEPTSIAQLVDELRAMGVQGRHVMVHSSYRAIRPVENGPQGVVDAFVEAACLGPGGYVLFPTFDFYSFTEQGYWDSEESPSRMGIISEKARQDPRFIRTNHPMLSFATFASEGIDRDVYVSYYTGNWHLGHGVGSIFDTFIQNDGLLLSFSGDGFRADDVGYTLVNHSMAVAGASHRFMKCFEGIAVLGGAPLQPKIWASVHREGYQNAVTAAHEQAEEEGIIHSRMLGNTWVKIASAREFHEWAMVNCITRPELFRRELT